MGHNYYGEPAWPNDLLYIFPVVILGTIACNVGLAVLEPSMNGEPADPFETRERSTTRVIFPEELQTDLPVHQSLMAREPLNLHYMQ